MTSQRPIWGPDSKNRHQRYSPKSRPSDFLFSGAGHRADMALTGLVHPSYAHPVLIATCMRPVWPRKCRAVVGGFQRDATGRQYACFHASHERLPGDATAPQAARPCGRRCGFPTRRIYAGRIAPRHVKSWCPWPCLSTPSSSPTSRPPLQFPPSSPPPASPPWRSAVAPS